MTRRRPPTRHLPAALLVAGWVATGCRPVPEPIETREESSLNERSRAEIRRARPRPEPIRIATASDDAIDPVAEPPSKRPLLTLLKQARAFGLGVMLTTQNPVDLDYKGLTNAGTWFIGKLQTERDKMRVLEGLESVVSEAGTLLDRSDLDRLISSLDSRVPGYSTRATISSDKATWRTRWPASRGSPSP